MSLTPTEEAQTRQLIAQNAPLLSLASNEPIITSKLGATKVNLSQLPAASTIADADILLIRQGTADKSAAASIFKTYVSAPAASETVSGIVELATSAETIAGTDNTKAVHPAGAKAAFAQLAGLSTQLFNVASGTTTNNAVNFGQFLASKTPLGYQKFPSGIIVQWGVNLFPVGGASAFVTFPIAFPNYVFMNVATYVGDAGPGNPAKGITTSQSSTTVLNGMTVSSPTAQAGTTSQGFSWISIGY